MARNTGKPPKKGGQPKPAARTMPAALATKKRVRWVMVPVDAETGQPLPDPAPVEVPDPANAGDGCLVYVKNGKYVLTAAPTADGQYPAWDGVAKKVAWVNV